MLVGVKSCNDLERLLGDFLMMQSSQDSIIVYKKFLLKMTDDVCS